MTVNVSYTRVVYNMYIPDDENPEIARLTTGELNIYDGRVTNARIAREIPKRAVVEKVEKVDRKFELDGKKALAWFIENGTENSKERLGAIPVYRPGNP